MLFTASYIMLWALTLLLMVAVILMYRFQGKLLVLNEERSREPGPAIAEVVAAIRAEAADGRIITLGRSASRFQVVLFASSRCDNCKSLLPDLCRFVHENPHIEAVVVVAGQLEPRNREIYLSVLPALVPLVTSDDLTIPEAWRVQRFPFAVIVEGTNGVIVAKGPMRSGGDFAALLEQVVEVRSVG